MSADREWRDFARDILQACEDIIAFVADLSLDEFMSDRRTRFAVMRGYKIMGEASRYIPPALQVVYAEIDWRDMRAMRNRIAHGYFGIDDSILYEIAKERPPSMLDPLRRLVSHADRNGAQ